jgi:hypothetical protein
MVKMFKVSEDEKCGGCNWKVANLYMMADNQESANKIYKENERGLCGDCITQLLMEIGYNILLP